MNQAKYLICLIVFFVIGIVVKAQTTYNFKVDSIVQKLSNVGDTNIAVITKTVTKPFADRQDKAQAIFFWITHNIKPDVKAFKQHDERRSLPEQVIKNKVGTPFGMSKLYQEMCSQVGIRCLTIDGYKKWSTGDIDEVPTEPNYTANAVQLGKVEDAWNYVDCFAAQGWFDNKISYFIPYYSYHYFFADPQCFNWGQFADNVAWQLGKPVVKLLKDFYSTSVYMPYAMQLQVKSFAPLKGMVHAVTNKPVHFDMQLVSDAAVGNVSLQIGDEKKIVTTIPIAFDSATTNKIVFDYTFKKPMQAPLYIMVNKKVVLKYELDVTDAE